MLALVCQYAHLKVDTLAHWQPVEITQCRSDGVGLAGVDDQASRCILYDKRLRKRFASFCRSLAFANVFQVLEI